MIYQPDKTLAAFAAEIENRGIRTMKKAEAQNALKAIFEEHAHQLSDSALFNLGQLYRHFMPPAARVPKTLAQWVAKAAGKRDARNYLNYVYADHTAGRLVAMDGHRMHVTSLPAQGFDQPGYYCPKTQEYLHGVEFATYPAYERIIPDRVNCEAAPVDPAAWELGETESGTVYYKTPCGALDKKYVDAVLAAPSVKFEYIYARQPGASGVCFAGDEPGVLALVMPIRMPAPR